MASFQDVFSLVAFFIFLRETLEASVIIAVLLQCMNRTAPRLKRHVWWGAAAGIGLSIVAGGVFAAVYYLASSKLFQGNGKLIFQGCISYVACALITYLGFAMLRFANLERKYMRKLDGAARAAAKQAAANGTGGPGRSHAWSVFILAATAVLREGIESVVFLAGVGSNTPPRALPLACLAGLVVGLAVGFAIYYSGRAIRDLKAFFCVSTIVLFFIAAGQVSLGTQLLSKAGMYGRYAAWADELTWQYRPVADFTACCDDEFSGGKQFFVLAHAVLGYQARPTPVILMAYCFYWAAVLLAVALKWRNGSLFDADYKRKRALLKLERRAAGAARAHARALRREVAWESKAEAAKAAVAGGSASQQAAAKASEKLAAARSERAARAQALAEAEAARDAEAERLEEEDARVAAAAGLSDAALPVVAPQQQQEGGSSGASDASDSAGAVAVIDGADVAGGKDVEAGGKKAGSGSGKDADSAGKGGSGKRFWQRGSK